MISLFNVTWSTNTAGPSPFNNKRTEVFFKGCKRAEEGNPCKGCFNNKLWNSEATIRHKPEEVASQINKFAPNKYVTIGGGEPTDQLNDLIILCKLLKAYNFHIMVYTWKSLLKHKLLWQLVPYIDILIDGEYDSSQRLYKEEAKDGFLSSIGSGNQVVWDLKRYNETGLLTCARMENLKGLELDTENKLIYIY